MIKIQALEFHVAHGCNLSCQQCSHYSNLRLKGSLPSIEDAISNYQAWSDRILPKRFALLGGEPTLNPDLVEHLRIARRYWPNSQLQFVTNGFFVHRHPDLFAVLDEVNCRMDVSQHGTDKKYMAVFAPIKEMILQKSKEYPRVKLRIRSSHKGWMRQYNVIDGKPVPFSSDPESAYKICMQKTCTQLFEQKLWKCPALAYFAMMDKKAKLESSQAWQSFRDYQPCSPEWPDDAVRTFLETKAIPQCSLCPSNRIPHPHPSAVENNPI